MRVACFAGPREFREFFSANYGPTVLAYRNLDGDAARVAALDSALEELARDHWSSDGSMSWEYLLVTGTRTTQ